MSVHVMLAVEGGVAHGAVPFGLAEVDGAFVGEEVGAQAEREATLFASVRTLSLVHRADVRVQVRLRLKLESTSITRELTHFFMNNHDVPSPITSRSEQPPAVVARMRS